MAWSCAKIHFIKICHRTKCLSAYKYKKIARFHKFKKCPLYSVRRVKSCCRNNIDVLPHIENHWANSTAGTRAKHLKKKKQNNKNQKCFSPPMLYLSLAVASFAYGFWLFLNRDWTRWTCSINVKLYLTWTGIFDHISVDLQIVRLFNSFAGRNEYNALLINKKSKILLVPRQCIRIG